MELKPNQVGVLGLGWCSGPPGWILFTGLPASHRAFMVCLHSLQMPVEQESPCWRIAPNIAVVRGACIGGGVEAFVARVPDRPGVYVWHQDHTHLAKTDQPRELVRNLAQSISAPHCLPRRASLGPAFAVSLESSRALRKSGELEEALKGRAFKQSLQEILGLSMFLQAPLYVGKASQSLRVRVRQHLDGSSGLRARLEEAEIVLRKCTVLFVESPTSALPPESKPGSDDALPHQGDHPGDDCPPPQPREELLLEELISKLFLPTFSQRYA